MGYRKASFTIRLVNDSNGTSAPQSSSHSYNYTFSIDNLDLLGFDDTTSITSSPYGSGSISTIDEAFGGVGHERNLAGGANTQVGDTVRVSISVSMNSGTSCSSYMDLVVTN